MTDRTVPQYDFYATPQRPAGGPGAPIPPGPVAPSAPSFGGGAVNQFGTPLGTPGATLPAAYASAASPPVRSGGVHVPRWARRWGATLVVMLVLGLFGVGRLGFLDVFHHDLEAPTTLAGLPAAAPDSPVRQSLQALLAEMDAAGEEVVVEVYSDEASRAVVLVAEPGEDPASPATELSRDGLSPLAVGEATCAVDRATVTSLCVRVGDGRTVMVVQTGTDTASTAAVLGEAFTALG